MNAICSVWFLSVNVAIVFQVGAKIASCNLVSVLFRNGSAHLEDVDLFRLFVHLFHSVISLHFTSNYYIAQCYEQVAHMKSAVILLTYTIWRTKKALELYNL